MTDVVFEERWYLCELTENAPGSAVEPDWSRVPEAKREEVRERWRKSQEVRVTSLVKLWGPQIPFFQRQPGYVVKVMV